MKWARVVGNSDIVATGLTDIPHYYLLFLIIKRKAQIINFHCTIEQKKDLNVYCHLLSGTTLSRCWSAWLHLSSRGCRDVKPGQLGLKQAGNWYSWGSLRVIKGQTEEKVSWKQGWKLFQAELAESYAFRKQPNPIQWTLLI